MSLIIDNDLILDGGSGSGSGGNSVITSAGGPTIDQENGLLIIPAGTPGQLLFSQKDGRLYVWELVDGLFLGEDGEGEPIIGSAYLWVYKPALPAFAAIGVAYPDGQPLAAAANDLTGTPMQWYTDDRPGIWTSGSGDGGNVPSALMEVHEQGTYEIQIGIMNIEGGNQDDYVAFFLEAADTDDEASDSTSWYATPDKMRYLGNVRRVGNKIAGSAGTFSVNHAGEPILDGDGNQIGHQGKSRISAYYVTTEALGATGDAQFRVKQISPSAGF